MFESDLPRGGLGEALARGVAGALRGPRVVALALRAREAAGRPPIRVYHHVDPLSGTFRLVGVDHQDAATVVLHRLSDDGYFTAKIADLREVRP